MCKFKNADNQVSVTCFSYVCCNGVHPLATELPQLLGSFVQCTYNSLCYSSMNYYSEQLPNGLHMYKQSITVAQQKVPPAYYKFVISLVKPFDKSHKTVYSCVFGYVHIVQYRDFKYPFLIISHIPRTVHTSALLRFRLHTLSASIN